MEKQECISTKDIWKEMDIDGNLISIKTCYNGEMKIDYYENNKIIRSETIDSIISKYNETILYKYDEQGRLIEAKDQTGHGRYNYNYDIPNVITWEDESSFTWFKFTKTINPTDGSFTIEYHDEHQNTTKTEYDSKGEKIHMVSSNGMECWNETINDVIKRLKFISGNIINCVDSIDNITKETSIDENNHLIEHTKIVTMHLNSTEKINLTDAQIINKEKSNKILHDFLEDHINNITKIYNKNIDKVDNGIMDAIKSDMLKDIVLWDTFDEGIRNYISIYIKPGK